MSDPSATTAGTSPLSGLSADDLSTLADALFARFKADEGTTTTGGTPPPPPPPPPPGPVVTVGQVVKFHDDINDVDQFGLVIEVADITGDNVASVPGARLAWLGQTSGLLPTSDLALP